MQETRSRYSSTDCGICWSIIENGKINNLSSFLSHNILLFSQRGLKCLVFPQHRLNKYTIVCRIQPHQWMECRIARSCNSGDSTSWNGISPIRWWNSDWITSRRSRRNIRFLLIPMCNRQSQATFEKLWQNPISPIRDSTLLQCAAIYQGEFFFRKIEQPVDDKLRRLQFFQECTVCTDGKLFCWMQLNSRFSFVESRDAWGCQ